MPNWCKGCLTFITQAAKVWQDTPEWAKVLVILVLANPILIAVALACGARVTTLH